MNIQKVNGLKGEVQIPGDKSISHRGIMLGALAKGTTKITNFLQGADCLSTIGCFRQMGIEIENTSNEVLVHGKGLHGLRAPQNTLDVGNSGTTMRLLCGILSPQAFASALTGDRSIQTRPMKRVIEPLSQMGADIQSLKGNGCAPLQIQGSRLKGIHYQSPVASAQVKSCVLFAGMYADKTTSVTEPVLSRNHSELMLQHLGAKLSGEGTTVSIEPEPLLEAREIPVPGDISSAAYFIAAGLLVPHSQILIKNVGVNPTRSGMLKVCHAMGADITATCDGMIINGGRRLTGADIRTQKDHRIAMSFAVAALAAEGVTHIGDADCVNISYPEFYQDLQKLGGIRFDR